MESREAWSALQSLLTTARARLDVGDYSAALEAVKAALAIDPAFLAAHALRQRIELDRLKAAPPTEASRPETGTTVTTSIPAVAAAESNPAPAPRAPAGRRFGVLLADVYEKKRTDPEPLVEAQGHRTAIPPPVPPTPAPPEAPPPPQAEPVPAVVMTPVLPPVAPEALPPVLPPVAPHISPPVLPPVGPQVLFAQPAEDLAARRIDDEIQEVAGDVLGHSESLDPDFFDLRLNGDDDLDGSDDPLFDSSRTTSRGPRLVFVGAVVLAALIIGERPFHFELSRFTSLIELPNFTTASVTTEPEPEPLSLLTARQLENPPVELAAGRRSMDAEVTAPRTPDADVRPADAPTIRTVAVSTPVPASTLADTPRVSRTTTTPPPVGEAPAAPPEPPAVVPASVPAPTAAAPAPRTADAEPASFTRSGGEAPVAARGETPVAASSVVPSSAVDEQSVKTALQRYRTAYERLDAKSARTVWPSVNEAALARAFGSLESQTLTFASCDVDFRGPAAVATCEGSTKYTPRYGSHEPREEPRVWTFTLKRNGAEWKIDSVKAGR